MPITLQPVENVAEAERVARSERGQRTEVWKEIADSFLGSDLQYARFTPSEDERLANGTDPESGEQTYLGAGSVASSLNSYAKNRNLGFRANATGEGQVQLSRVAVEGEPREPQKAGRRRKSQPTEAE